MNQFLLPLLLVIVAASVCETNATGPTPIAYKRVTTYDFIYNNRKTGSNTDLSIWRPTTNQFGFFALGDVAVPSHSKPQASAMLVEEIEIGSLAKPLSFTQLWNDRGSGGTQDVRLMGMNPPRGYTCLGDVAVIGYSTTPDTNKYRCVKTEYITQDGFYQLIWKDKGSGANRDGSVWGIRPSSTLSLDANCFGAQGSHTMPSMKPKTLNSKFAKSTIEIATDSSKLALTVYETTDMNLIYNDKGTGSDRDVSMWRPNGVSGTFSLGDIAVPNYNKPLGYVVKGLKDGALASPVDYRVIWTDRGSGGDWDGSFWEPICRPGYRAMGHASIRSYSKPPLSALKCLKEEYAVIGQWHYVWNDRGSGADRDVSVWKAIAGSIPGQSVQAMTTVGSHNRPSQLAYVIKADVMQYRSGPPVKKYLLRNVQYNFNDKSITDQKPATLERTVVENRGDTTQKATRQISYTYSETMSFSSSMGIEIGVSVEAETGIPLIASGKVTTSVTTSFSFEFGKQKTKEKSDSISVEVEVKPKSTKEATIVATQYKTDVPYTAELTTVFADDRTSVNKAFKGIYRGVQVSDVRVVVGPDIPL